MDSIADKIAVRQTVLGAPPGVTTGVPEAAPLAGGRRLLAGPAPVHRAAASAIPMPAGSLPMRSLLQQEGGDGAEGVLALLAAGNPSSNPSSNPSPPSSPAAEPPSTGSSRIANPTFDNNSCPRDFIDSLKPYDLFESKVPCKCAGIYYFTWEVLASGNVEKCIQTEAPWQSSKPVSCMTHQQGHLRAT